MPEFDLQEWVPWLLWLVSSFCIGRAVLLGVGLFKRKLTEFDENVLKGVMTANVIDPGYGPLQFQWNDKKDESRTLLRDDGKYKLEGREINKHMSRKGLKELGKVVDNRVKEYITSLL